MSDIPTPRSPADDFTGPTTGVERIVSTLTDVRLTLGRVEERVRTTAELAEDHENRLRTVERWLWSLPGSAVASAVAAIASLIAATKH